MKLLLRRSVLVVAVLLLAGSSSFALLLPSTAKAEDYGWGEGITAYDQARRWLFYRGMRGCLEGYSGFSYGVHDDVSTSDVNAGTWMDNDGEEGFGFVARELNFDQSGGDDQDGDVRCDDGSIWVRGATAFGFNDVVDLVCAMNRAQTKLDMPNKMISPNGTGDNGKPDCESSTQFSFGLGGEKSDWQRSLTQALTDEGSGTRPKFDMNGDDSSLLMYIIGKESLLTFCGEKGDSRSFEDRLGNNTNDDNRVSVDVVDEATGEIDQNRKYIIYGGRDQNSEMHDVTYLTDSQRNTIGDGGGNSNEGDDLKCYEIARMTQGHYAEAYSDYVVAHPDGVNEDPGGIGNEDPEDDDTTCAVDGIGWIVCPVVTFLTKLNDAAFGFLNNFLTVPAQVFNDAATRGAWQAFRNVANIAFVAAFLIIIYSQITGAGVTNYGIKRLLPKLIIAAILVNVSFYICGILVDLSNIFGSGLYNFVGNVNIGDDGGGGGALSSVWSTAGAVILATGAIIGLIALIIFAPSALLAFALIILILIARQAFVVLLIVLSPLAFVAYLLPNTEKWFKKWWSSFSAMLMVYPIIALVFGASTLASNILMRVSEDGAGGGDDEQMLKIVAAAVLAIPLFAVPFLLKGSMSAAGAVGARLSGLQDRATRRAGRGIKEGRLGEAKTAFDARRQQRKVDARLGNGRVTKAGRFLSERGWYGGKTLETLGGAGTAFDRSSVGRYLGGDRGAAAAVYEQNKLKNEAVERSIALLQENKAADVVPKARQQLIEANKNGDVIGARAATRVLAQQTGSRGIDQLHSAISEIEKDGGTLHDNIGESVKHEVTAAGLKGKNRSLDKWSRAEPTPTGTRLGDYDADVKSVSGLNEAELAGHSGAMLRAYWQTGALEKSSADRVLAAHKKGTVPLDEEKLSILQAVSKGTPPPSP